MAKLTSLTQYLNWYHTNCQQNITLVYRGDLQQNWAKRCHFLDENYHPKLRYNHRSIMDKEVVLEYDNEDPELNKKLVDKVCQKLTTDGIQYSKWKSGNKSTHIHILFDFKTCRNISLMKTVIMRTYGTFWYDKNTHKVYDNYRLIPQLIKDTEGRLVRLLPDLRLSSIGHLIRAEYGVHEKSGRHKSLIYKSVKFPWINAVPSTIWNEYSKEQERSVKYRTTIQISDLHNSDLIKKLLDTTKFRDSVGDGRERIMFALIHILKHKHDKDSLTALLWDWYKYSGGYKMSEEDVRQKIKYHWNRDYNITQEYLNRILEEVSATV